MRAYVDTNIYIDCFTNRNGLGENAGNIFIYFQQGRYKLVVSDWVLFELNKYIDEKDKMKEFFQSMKENTVRITYSEDDIKEAKELSPSNWQDALHAILAKKANAKYLITRNKRDFIEFDHLVKPKFPGEFIRI